MKYTIIRSYEKPALLRTSSSERYVVICHSDSRIEKIELGKELEDSLPVLMKLFNQLDSEGYKLASSSNSVYQLNDVLGQALSEYVFCKEE